MPLNIMKIKMRILFAFIMFFSITGCQKERIAFSENASDVFYVENAGESMRVLVHGNTTHNTFILVIHGGPGASSFLYDTQYIRENIGNNYAMVYWDQRNTGASQGTSNSKNLHLDQMVDDLKKVIQVLKYRYGQDMSLFLLGHSFGGLIAADFVTRPELQSMIQGLINVDGSHNYPLNDTLTRQMLLSVANYQVSKGKNLDKWNPIIRYCNIHSGNFNFEESQQLESYASEAETYIDSVQSFSIFSQLLIYAIPNHYPVTAMAGNLIFSEDSNFNKELAVTQFSDALHNVTIPVLLLWGKYDFVCPPELGVDFYNRINSQEKKMVVSSVSGHNLIWQDKKLLCDEVNIFVSKYR
jgi:pimeloyl-ACP methyl ester carboxylesterase